MTMPKLKTSLIVGGLLVAIGGVIALAVFAITFICTSKPLDAIDYEVLSSLGRWIEPRLDKHEIYISNWTLGEGAEDYSETQFSRLRTRGFGSRLKASRAMEIDLARNNCGTQQIDKLCFKVKNLTLREFDSSFLDARYKEWYEGAKERVVRPAFCRMSKPAIGEVNGSKRAIVYWLCDSPRVSAEFISVLERDFDRWNVIQSEPMNVNTDMIKSRPDDADPDGMEPLIFPPLDNSAWHNVKDP
ncbi:MAG: hypothetical protein JWN70_1841 [Planctomycetaceae bacterium]|nr:hypothetical protein [Planctomycetaceae bacterium]